MDCPICKKQLDLNDKSICAKLRQKGCITINEYAEKNQDDWRVSPGDYVHKDCRRNYTHPRTLKEITQNESSTDLQLNTRSNNTFDFKTHCGIDTEFPFLPFGKSISKSF